MMIMRYSLDYENCNLEYDPKGDIVDYGDHCAVVFVLQSRLEELNQKVEELEKENASLKPMAERYVWLRDHYHGFEHYRSGLAKKMNMFESDISKAMRSAGS